MQSWTRTWEIARANDDATWWTAQTVGLEHGWQEEMRQTHEELTEESRKESAASVVNDICFSPDLKRRAKKQNGGM